jgi:hypothetical protein
MSKSPLEFRALVIARLDEVFAQNDPKECAEILLAANECCPDPDALIPFAEKALLDPDKRVRQAARIILKTHKNVRKFE